jgi:hypothetical protein
MQLTKSEQTDLLLSIFELLSQGKNKDDIAEEIGIGAEKVESLIKRLIDFKTEEYQNKPIEHTYFEYVINQLKNIADLTKLINKNINKKSSTRSLSAVVGAIKARSEIHERILKSGQECGVIRRAPDRKETVHGVYIAELTAADLKHAIVSQYEKLKKLTTGEQENIIDIPVTQDLYYGESINIKDEEIKIDDHPFDVDEKIQRKAVEELESHKPKKKKKKKKKRKERD